MCGRIVQYTYVDTIMGTFRVAHYIDDEPFRPRYNIPPSANILTVRSGADGERELVRLKWGFVPHWAKDLKGPKPCNARAETVAEKPLFRDAFKRRRCIVPVDAFYEWQSSPRGKQAFCYRREDEHLFGIAGIWSRWQGEGAALETVSLVVIGANDLMSPIHDRVPVIIQPDAYDEWLAPEPIAQKRIKDFLSSPSSAGYKAYPVSAAVNRPINDSEKLLDPIAVEPVTFSIPE